MISVGEAVDRLRQGAQVLVGGEDVLLADGLGRVLASDVVSPIDVPPADNSAMDGYALRREDWHGPDQALDISQRVTAGTPPAPLVLGTAARIFTGAEIPPGADVVVMQEKCSADTHSVRMDSVGASGANIRPRAQDIEKGATVLEKGRRLRAQDMGLIASLGVNRIRVMQRLKVAVVSTGEELVEPGEEAGPGQIYNSNRYTLNALLQGWGFEVVDFRAVADDAGTLAEVMRKAAGSADVIVTSGGVSVGEEDHVKAVVESLGRLDLWRVAIKPGKPFAFGEVLGKPFLGLPGNPVAVLVTALIIGRPYLFDCQGVGHADVVPGQHPALFDKKAGLREEFLRVRIRPDGVEMYPQQSSGVLSSTCWGDAIAVQKPGQEIRRGDRLEVIRYAVLN
jgi:molybdopterin molybdotransferase